MTYADIPGNRQSSDISASHKTLGSPVQSITLEQKVRVCARRLAEAGVETADLDARLIVAHGTGKSSEDLVRDACNSLDSLQEEAISDLLNRRLAREPLGYVTGVKEFWSLDFAVTHDTLIPRPDSETLILKALEVLRPYQQKLCTDHGPSILDLGTGTGCLLLSLLSELPEARGVGVDIDRNALEVAQGNARSHGLSGRAMFVESDWDTNISDRFNLVITNPPYIRTSDLVRLAPEVRQFEPRLALDGGGDGLEAYRLISRQLSQLLLPGGWIIVEIGSDQAEDVKKILFDQTPLHFIELAHDFARRPRCLVGQFLG